MHKRKQWEKYRRADLGLKQSESSQEFPLLKSEEYTSVMVQPAITVPGTRTDAEAEASTLWPPDVKN